MAFDGITVAALTHELSEKLTGARISKIIQPEGDALLITCKSQAGQERLYLSASASLPLVYLTDQNRKAPDTAPNFCMLLRKHIGNGRIVRIWQPALERIIRFQIEHYDEMGDLRTKDLIVELMGKHSNIIFCSEDGRIIDSIKHISAQTSSVREVLPGREYFVPETMHKEDPLKADEAVFIREVFSKAMPLSKAVYSSFTGISPLMAEEVCCRAGADPAQAAGTIEPMMRTHMAHQFVLLMEDVRAAHFSPAIILGKEGEPLEFSMLPLSVYAGSQQQPCASVSILLRNYYELKDKVTRIRQKSADLRRIAATAAERTARKLSLQEKQMHDTLKKDKYRLYGELLHTYGYGAPAGIKSLEVTDFYTGEPVTIPLDETLTAPENAVRYYEKYSKLKRTGEALQEQIEQTRADLEQLDSIRTFLDMALGEEDLVQVREELEEAGYIRRKGPSGKKKKIVSRPYHYQTEDGYDLYVGKNNYQNDELTFRMADGGDWWFHAKGAPGSHVIARTRGGELPDHVFEDAARLAAYYSASRGAGKAEIDYVQKKHVKKPAGAKPGFVVYYTNYSMVMDTDISRLKLVED